MLEYDRHILRVLTEAGHDGLSVQKIARHVFNASNTFFCAVDFEDIYKYVRQYLARNSKGCDSLVENTGVRGMYRLNMNSGETRQLMLCFMDDSETEEKPQVCNEDRSLSLFD